MPQRKGVIYLVPVPIGNLRDITLRALDTLAAVPLIACEDTRKTGFLLKEYQISPPKLLSFHKFNEKKRELQLLEHLQSGEDLAIVSDAGSPAISDPALLFIQRAISEDIRIIALPGATALIPSITVSGLGKGRFQFIGFLPSRKKARESIYQELRSYPHPSIIYLSVHDVKDTLAELYEYLGERRISISREISKLHEECIRGSLKEIVNETELTLKGEFVVVIDGATADENIASACEMAEYIAHKSDTKTKELAAELAAKYGISKSAAYQYVMEIRNK